MAETKRGFRPSPLAASILGTALALLLVLAWQADLGSRTSSLDPQYRNRAAAGPKDSKAYVYFFHYLGLYPATVRGESDSITYSREGAEKLLHQAKERLVMDGQLPYFSNLRVGDHGVILLYALDALLMGGPEKPDLRVPNGLAFVLALMALLIAFIWAKKPLLGVLLVLLLGSNPFQLYEVYGNENVFGWVITAAVAAMALQVPALGLRPVSGRVLVLCAIASGLILAFVRQVRSEAVVTLISVLASCLLIPGVTWRRRIAIAAVVALSFGLSARAWTTYFGHTIEKTRAVVASVGGRPFQTTYYANHRIWPPLWCGLGDFDTRYGYVWDDRASVQYARRVIAEKYKVELPPWDGQTWSYTSSFLDEAQAYSMALGDIPHFDDVLRDKFLGDIRHDPAWYAGIILRRLVRLANENTPARIAVLGYEVALPISFALVSLVAAVLVVRKRWTLLRLLAFPLPLGLPALLIYSNRGMSYYQTFHLVAVAIGLYLLAEQLPAGIEFAKRAMHPPRQPRN